MPLRLFARKCLTGTIVLAMLAMTVMSIGAMQSQEYKSGIIWPEPPVVDAGSVGGPPSDAIVLFDGTDLSQWEGGEKWIIQDGYAITSQTSITSKQAFGDCQLHVEFACPEELEGEGQGRGNSGIFLMGRYEVQLLDSYQNDTYFDGQCGAVYKQQPPIVNACRKPGEWQSFDIIFTAPRFAADGKLESPAYVTVLHNNVLIHNHLALDGSTSFVGPAKYEPHADKLPIELQFHRDAVRYRNIWVRENIHRSVGEMPGSEPDPEVAANDEGTAPEPSDKP